MYIGQKYDSCWCFAQDYYATEMGIKIPADAYSAREHFELVEAPQNGDLVMIDNGGHCGIYQDRGILNHTNSAGVVKNRVEHFFKKTYYRHCSMDS